MARSLRTRTSRSNTRSLAYFQWPMLDLIRKIVLSLGRTMSILPTLITLATARNSSSPLSSRDGSTTNMLSSERSRTTAPCRLSKPSRRPAPLPVRTSMPMCLPSSTVGSRSRRFQPKHTKVSRVLHVVLKTKEKCNAILGRWQYSTVELSRPLA